MLWKNNNANHVRLYNEFYRNNKSLSIEERNLLWQRLKEEHGIEEKVRGVASKQRKLHTEKDGTMGKECSVSGCGWKPLTEFHNKAKSWDQLRPTCKNCLAQKSKAYRKAGRINRTLQNNLSWRLRQNIHGRIISSLKNCNARKENNTILYMGCSMIEFKEYLQSQFTDGMSWSKYGFFIDEQGKKQMGFHVDHIIPCCAFDLTDPKIRVNSKENDFELF